jgi:hypothetical protein
MTETLKKIIYRQQLIALVIYKNLSARANQFLTQPDSALQLGVLSFKKGDRVKPHAHLSLKKITHQNQEFIYLKTGKVEVSFFYQNTLVCKKILNAGDCLLQISGGHGFIFLQPTELITVKQGPYKGVTKEKKFLVNV